MAITSEKTINAALNTNKAQKKLVRKLAKKHLLLTSLAGTVEALEALTDITKGIRDSIEYLESRKEWNFNWIDGGWNSTFAVTREDAIANAVSEFSSDTLVPDSETFRVATDADTKALLSLFY